MTNIINFFLRDEPATKPAHLKSQLFCLWQVSLACICNHLKQLLQKPKTRKVTFSLALTIIPELKVASQTVQGAYAIRQL